MASARMQSQMNSGRWRTAATPRTGAKTAFSNPALESRARFESGRMACLVLLRLERKVDVGEQVLVLSGVCQGLCSLGVDLAQLFPPQLHHLQAERRFKVSRFPDVATSHHSEASGSCSKQSGLSWQESGPLHNGLVAGEPCYKCKVLRNVKLLGCT